MFIVDIKRNNIWEAPSTTQQILASTIILIISLLCAKNCTRLLIQYHCMVHKRPAK